MKNNRNSAIFSLIAFTGMAVCLATVLPVIDVFAGSNPSPPPASTTLTSSNAVLKASNGTQIELQVQASQPPSGQGGLDIRLATGTKPGATYGNGEQHGFYFGVPASDLALTTKRGKLTGATFSSEDAQLGAFGSISLSFTTSGTYRSLPCRNANQGYYDHVYSGSLQGTIDLKTNNAGEVSQWGELKGSLSFPKETTLVQDNGCSPPGTKLGNYLCYSSFHWDSPQVLLDGATVNFYGSDFTSKGVTSKAVYFDRMVQLSNLGTGVSGSRQDTDVDSKIGQTFQRSTRGDRPFTVTIGPTGSADAIASGKATMTSQGSAGGNVGKCFPRSSSKTAAKTEHVFHGDGNYVYTPASSKLTGRSAIGGNMTLPASVDDGQYAYVEQDSYS